MKDQIASLLEAVHAFSPENAEQVEQFRIEYLGSKNGKVTNLFKEFKALPGDQKREFGQPLNQLKNAATERVNELKAAMANQTAAADDSIDLTLPADAIPLGSRHPISIVRKEIIDIFSRIGFTVAEGPEIEDDWHNFSALNFPPEHPARDMQDTFFIEKGENLPAGRQGDMALRTHTSSVQVRMMEKQEPPIRMIMPGRVFRNEAISTRSHCIFHQIEGLYIDENVSFADMKQTLNYFTKEFFGKSKIRLRPSYFPFTEPSAEVDVYWGLETEADYRITKGTGWLEVMGCGMVDPNVLSANGIDPEKYTGFAFGMGIERIAMQRFGIEDIRMLFENDIRFLKQFTSAY